MAQLPEKDRPDMPAGYGLAKPGKGLLPWEPVVEKLTEARNYWLSTTRSDGRPHASPVWGLWQEDCFYFGTDPTSQKARNLAANPAIVVHLESGDDVVILEGIVAEITEEPLLAQLRAAYELKYAVAATPQYMVRPHTVFAWMEHSFPDTATRFRFPG